MKRLALVTVVALAIWLRVQIVEFRHPAMLDDVPKRRR